MPVHWDAVGKLLGSGIGKRWKGGKLLGNVGVRWEADGKLWEAVGKRW